MTPVLTAGLVGAAIALAGVPYAWSWLTPLPLALLFALITRARSPRAAFWLAFTAGAVFFGVHLAWLPLSFARLFGVSGAALTLLIVPLLAITWALSASVTRAAAGPFTLAALPFVWVVVEYARSLGPLAFPWGTLGYALLPTPLAQTADLGGVTLLSLLVALSAAGLAAFSLGQRAPLLGVLALLSGATAYGLTRNEPPEPDRVALLVQGAVPPLQKAARRGGWELDIHANLTRQGVQGAPVDLVVWPESASPLAPDTPSVRSALHALRVPLVFGAPTLGRGSYWNSAYAFNGRITGRYDKVRPVPFGEFLPWRRELSFAYNPVLQALGLRDLWGVTPGETYQPLPLNGVAVGAYISYESVFPQAARTLTARGATVFTHLSNDAWFNGTIGKEQHFQMGRLRAIETRRYVLRASNDGVSGVIDPLGRVTARFPEGTRQAFRAPFAYTNRVTVYVRWGDWVPWASAVTWAAVVFTARRHERRAV